MILVILLYNYVVFITSLTDDMPRQITPLRYPGYGVGATAVVGFCFVFPAAFALKLLPRTSEIRGPCENPASKAASADRRHTGDSSLIPKRLHSALGQGL
jgi:hypothetical protein